MIIDVNKKYRTRDGRMIINIEPVIPVDKDVMELYSAKIVDKRGDGCVYHTAVYNEHGSIRFFDDKPVTVASPECDLVELVDYPVECKDISTKYKLRPEVEWFAELMERKMVANDYKGGWQSYSKEWLFEHLIKEVSELYNAMLRYDNEKEFSKIQLECADVSNYAMMMADVIKLKHGGNFEKNV